MEERPKTPTTDCAILLQYLERAGQSFSTINNSPLVLSDYSWSVHFSQSVSDDELYSMDCGVHTLSSSLRKILNLIFTAVNPLNRLRYLREEGVPIYQTRYSMDGLFFNAPNRMDAGRIEYKHCTLWEGFRASYYQSAFHFLDKLIAQIGVRGEKANVWIIGLEQRICAPALKLYSQAGIPFPWTQFGHWDDEKLAAAGRIPKDKYNSGLLRLQLLLEKFWLQEARKLESA
jgi:hypothetical protein